MFRQKKTTSIVALTTNPWIILVFSSVFLLNLVSPSNGCAQETTGDQAVYRDGQVQVPLTDELQGGLIFHTQGAGLTIRRGVYKNAFQIKWWGTDLVMFRHPKEVRTQNPIYENGRPYIYGKQNTLQLFRIWRGGQKLSTEKLRKDAVRFGQVWKYGLSLGVLKPVYLEIGYPDIPYDYVATERYDPTAHFSDNIYGQASWTYGLDELDIVPGFHASYALDFEYGTVRHVQKTMTVGAAVDVFLESPEIFAAKFEQNTPLFVTLFATFELGRNWTR